MSAKVRRKGHLTNYFIVFCAFRFLLWPEMPTFVPHKSKIMIKKLLQQARLFFAKPFWSDHRTLLALWLLLPIIGGLVKINKCNNFLIFRYVFWHAWNGTSLYAPYPGEHTDVNHYGPLFSLVVAPFAIMPHFIGLLLWCVALSLFLYVAIRKSQFNKFQQIFILWFCAHELLTALFMQQFNIAIAAIILLSFYFK